MPRLNVRRCFMKSLLHIWCGSFLPVIVEEWSATFVQFRGKKSLPLSFPVKRPLLQNCIMLSSVCTNGYFCRIALISSLGPPSERPILSQSDRTPPGQAWIPACQLWPMYFSHFWPKTINCWMDTTTNKSILYFFLISNLQMKISNPWLSQMNGNIRIFKIQSGTIEEWC